MNNNIKLQSIPNNEKLLETPTGKEYYDNLTKYYDNKKCDYTEYTEAQRKLDDYATDQLEKLSKANTNKM